MDKNINVLIFPCGSENALEIHQALKDVVNIKLFGASGKDDHGSYVFRNYIGEMPYINNKNFLMWLNKLVELKNIDVIIPTHDDVVLKLAEVSSQIKAKIAIPGLDQSIICRSKKKTYEIFKDYSFCPKVFDSLSEINEFPIFAKPDAGQGAKGVMIIDKSNINYLTDELLIKYVFCEFLPGEEITVDCFTDKNGILRFVGPRKRERVFSGISVRSFTIELTKEIENTAKTISNKLKMNGLWYFQLKKDSLDNYKLLEVSVRTAGTMNLYRGLGVNFPLLTIYNLLEYEINILCNNYYLEVDRAFINRYKLSLKYNTIYIDFDDTITRNGNVNFEVMMFLYNVKFFQKKIILLTKHENDIYETLNKLFIHQGLFDEIIQIKKTENKYQYIKHPDDAIFIDNSFYERNEIKKYHNISVFDVDAIPTLINWKN
jgi:hypothetical protein